MCNDYVGVEKFGYNCVINCKKYYSKEIIRELNDEVILRYVVYYELLCLIIFCCSYNEFYLDNNFIIDTINLFVMCILRSNVDGNCLIGLFNVSKNI